MTPHHIVTTTTGSNTIFFFPPEKKSMFSRQLWFSTNNTYNKLAFDYLLLFSICSLLLLLLFLTIAVSHSIIDWTRAVQNSCEAEQCGKKCIKRQLPKNCNARNETRANGWRANMTMSSEERKRGRQYGAFFSRTIYRYVSLHSHTRHWKQSNLPSLRCVFYFYMDESVAMSRGREQVLMDMHVRYGEIWLGLRFIYYSY